jgi:hypothetical protein
MKKKILLIMIALVTVASACNKSRGMEVRTYTLNRLTVDDAGSIIQPYIREGGYYSGKNRLITIREKPDRLKVIEDLLKKYDGLGDAVDIVLNVQIIEANGFTERDSAIADIEQTLRETFKYRGYRLAGETRILAREGTGFRTTTAGDFIVEGEVERVAMSGEEQRVPIELRLMRRPTSQNTQPIELAGTITGTIGKPTVLGQSTNQGAIILVIRPSIAKP